MRVPAKTLLSLLMAFPSVLSAQDKLQCHDPNSPQLGDLSKVGTCHFPISCDPTLQADFDRALAVLHSFWYDQARKQFQAIAVKDPSCAMAQWGIAMTYYHPLWAPPTPEDLAAGTAAAQKALALGPKTPRELAYVEALNTFYKNADSVDHRTRALAYEKSMENLYKTYPKDDEVGIFYALSLNGTFLFTDKSYTNVKKAGKLLEELSPRNPNHPGIAHYIIHSYDYPPLAAQALPVARSYAKIAPGVPHALHMPSHIFTRLGLWGESIQSNLASSQTAQAYAAQLFPGKNSFEQLHALDYLEYAYLQVSDLPKAQELVHRCAAMKAIEPADDFAAVYALATLPARYQVETRNWPAAAALPVAPSFITWSKFPHMEASIQFAKALGAAHTGDLKAARAATDRLGVLYAAIPDPKLKYWKAPVEIQRLEAEAWLAYASGDKAHALELMRSAVTLEDGTEKHPVTPGPIIPAHELLADMLFDMGRPGDALVEYEISFTISPNRFNGIYGAARSAQNAALPQKARTYYAQLIEQTKNGAGERPALDEAHAYLKDASLRTGVSTDGKLQLSKKN